MMISVVQVDPRQHQDWLQRSCDYIRALYHPAEQNHRFDLDHLSRGRFVVVRAATIVGCGAIVPCGHAIMELKHIFIDAAARGLGCGKTLLRQLEQMAIADGVSTLVLETGDKQPEAFGLYCAFGYQIRATYIADPLPHAIFMEKHLI